jgi:hypothetical protein
LLKKSQIELKKIPLTAKENSFIYDIIDSKIGYLENEIYITVQFIKESEEPLSIKKYETQYEKIFKFSLDTQSFDPKPLIKVTPQYTDISKYSSNTEVKELYGDKQKIVKPLENLIGIDNARNMYFSEKDPILSNANINDQILYIYNSSGTLMKNVSVKYQQKIKYASDMYFSSNGKIFSYYIQEGLIHFVLIN